MKKLPHLLIISLVIMSLSAPSAITALTKPVPPAPDNWVVKSPEDHGMSSYLLEQAAQEIGKMGYRQGFVVVRHGVIVYEKYYHGGKHTKNFGYSTAKSFGSTLIGICVTQGLLDVDDLVTKWVPNPPSAINPKATIKHLLGQTSESNPPGSKFHYDSGKVVNTLSKVISAASNMRTDSFAKQYLLDPIGIKNSRWTGSIITGDLAIGGGGFWTCRDQARLGLLYVNKGNWRGTQIVSEDYIYDATHPSFPDANSAYGYLWWLNTPQGEYHRLFVSGTGKIMENAPDNIFVATGFFGQLIIVVPDLDIVITTMGRTRERETMYTLRKVWNAVLPALPTEANFNQL